MNVKLPLLGRSVALPHAIACAARVARQSSLSLSLPPSESLLPLLTLSCAKFPATHLVSPSVRQGFTHSIFSKVSQVDRRTSRPSPKGLEPEDVKACNWGNWGRNIHWS